MGFFETLAGAAAISGGSNVAGGIIGNLINQNFQENEATRNQSNFNITQDNFERNAQIRVADAKKAGLHPLYAMGANAPGPSGSQPVVLDDRMGPALMNAGQNVANILSRSDSADDKLLKSLQLDLLESQIAETDARAGYYGSEAMRNMQSGQSGLGIQPEYQNSIAPEGQAPNAPGFSNEGMINLKAPDVMSSKQNAPGFIAGKNDYYQEWRLRDGFYLPLPRSEDEGPEETIQNMSLPAWNGLLDQGQRLYGGNWKREMQDWRYKGIEPKGYYLSVSELGPRPGNRYESAGKGYYRQALDREVEKITKGIKDWIFGGRIKAKDFRK